MLCDDCHKNEAHIHIRQVSPEGSFDKNLCEQCAAKYGGFLGQPGTENLTVHDLLKGIFGSLPRPKAEEETAVPGLACPNCGMTYQDFVRSGRIGCGVCYDTFREQMAPLLTRIHGSRTHSGKIPRRSGGVLVTRHEIAVLKEKLEAAVKREEYEKAARYRDEIRALEQQLAAEKKEAADHAGQ
ncbi:MAG: UvrB/UvrC motif-containing protein [Schwartzia sp.]|nr:UvrB/UvrC motif-containing protein [Schwartzia sp. (in: firmicutes)]